MTLPRRHSSAISGRANVYWKCSGSRSGDVSASLVPLLRARRSACARMLKPFGVRRHERVLDAVVHHLDEMAGAGRAAVQVTLIGRADALLAPAP